MQFPLRNKIETDYENKLKILNKNEKKIFVVVPNYIIYKTRF